MLVPVDGGAFSAQDTAGDVAVLRVPLTITGGSGEAPPQVEARLLPAGESVSLEEAGAVAVADETTTVRICVDVLAPVPAAAGAPEDGVVRYTAPGGPLPTQTVCSPEESLVD